MTESLSLAQAAPPHSLPADLSSHNHLPPAPLPQEETADDDDGEIACICAFNGDDGNTIQCDKCLRWQHISCYYPPPKEVPGEDQKHYCTDCVPQPDLDSRKATDRQRKLLEQRNGANGVKRAAKTKKKVKDSPSLTAQPNGWPDRQAHLHNHDRKSASPRDQPPPTKKPKTTHRSSNPALNPSSRKRSTALNPPPVRSPSETPEIDVDNTSFIPQYSEEFLHLYTPQSPQIETDTNILNGIAVSNMLTSWLTDPEAVASVTDGLTQGDIFKRWDGRMEDIPGQPEVDVDWIEDPSFTSDEGMHPRWARLTLATPIAQGTFIGELRGHVGLKDEYTHEIDGRWNTLHHPEPFVFFHPQLPIFIDARKKGTKFRFVRRSCQPNAELQTIITEGTEYHFCFMATRDIVAGEEITVGWQVPEPLRVRINSNLASLSKIHPSVRDTFATWVSIILSNSGPCACTGLQHPSDCLMARYDRRGLSPPLRPIKVNKRKKKLAALDAGMASRSRSASAAPKTEQDDNMSESRSVSGSRGSVSRDITPTAHHPDSVLPRGFHQELSERERKKLMREEEMFKRQEQETGKSKKKRNSGGLNLGTSIAASSSRHESHKRSRIDGSEPKSASSQTNGKYADASTSSRPGMSSRTSSGRRRAAASSKLSRQDSGSTTKTKAVDYTDSSVQCDLDAVEDRMVRPERRLVTVTQRLFKRCLANQIKLKSSVDLLSPPTEAMEIDTDQPGLTNGVPPPQPEGVEKADPETIDIVMSDVPAVEQPKVEVASDPTPPATPDGLVKEVSPGTQVPVSQSIAPENSAAEPSTVVSDAAPPALMPAAPPADGLETVPVQQEAPAEDMSAVEPEHVRARPAMHLNMPPPAANVTAVLPPSASVMQSPSLMTPGTAASFNGALFSPSVTTAVTPSPVRKKLSLSDYTKRSKARETTTGDDKPTSALAKEVKEGQEGSPATETAPTDVPKDAPEEAITDSPAPKEAAEPAAEQPATEVSATETAQEAGKADAVMTDAPAVVEASAADAAPAAEAATETVQGEAGK